MKVSADLLTSLAARIADGSPVDWDAEVANAPSLEGEIRALQGIESIQKVQTPARVEADELLTPGTSWGPLEVKAYIGQGAAGHVYLAFDPALGREVALKIWRESAAYRPTGTEARRLGKVQHPGVLRVLGWERHDGMAGMWTDFLDGRNLEDILAEHGPFAVHDACRIGVALCRALEAVHAAGMVHRDVKTSNVMWLADESVVLIDFGSVKELPRGVPEKTARIRGTPLTTAPELMRDEPVAPTADIYSLGVLLYRLVTAAWPVEAGNYGELIRKIDAHESVPLRLRDPSCDPAFADLVDWALEWDPEDRPPSASTLREALERLLA